MSLSFFGTCFLIYRISQKVFPEKAVFNLVFWAFNPLVLIEGLVSSHNDMPMAFFSLLFFYFFIKNNYIKSSLSYLFSVGIKYASVYLLPVVLFLFYLNKKKKEINWERIFLYCLILSVPAIIAATLRTTFQPWYLLYALPFAALISKKTMVFISMITACIFGTIIYIPYVLLTDYDKSYPLIISRIEIVGLCAVILIPLLYLLASKLKRS
jgi:4-amino-4-deoxy-L-arabinose transferase-like glycosyltransferase